MLCSFIWVYENSMTKFNLFSSSSSLISLSSMSSRIISLKLTEVGWSIDYHYENFQFSSLTMSRQKIFFSCQFSNTHRRAVNLSFSLSLESILHLSIDQRHAKCQNTRKRYNTTSDYHRLILVKLMPLNAPGEKCSSLFSPMHEAKLHHVWDEMQCGKWEENLLKCSERGRGNKALNERSHDFCTIYRSRRQLFGVNFACSLA